MDCSPPGSSVHGILQARILEGVAERALKRKMKRTLIKKEKESKKKGRREAVTWYIQVWQVLRHVRVS